VSGVPSRQYFCFVLFGSVVPVRIVYGVAVDGQRRTISVFPDSEDRPDRVAGRRPAMWPGRPAAAQQLARKPPDVQFFGLPPTVPLTSVR
jgi:hypothetical protein